jgi:hypothetical protein
MTGVGIGLKTPSARVPERETWPQRHTGTFEFGDYYIVGNGVNPTLERVIGSCSGPRGESKKAP